MAHNNSQCALFFNGGMFNCRQDCPNSIQGLSLGKGTTGMSRRAYISRYGDGGTGGNGGDGTDGNGGGGGGGALGGGNSKFISQKDLDILKLTHQLEIAKLTSTADNKVHQYELEKQAAAAERKESELKKQIAELEEQGETARAQSAQLQVKLAAVMAENKKFRLVLQNIQANIIQHAPDLRQVLLSAEEEALLLDC